MSATPPDKDPSALCDAANVKKLLRHKAELAYRQSNVSLNSIDDDISPETVQEMLHELRVHQIELEMQNEELLRAKDEADVSRERFVDLYDLAPVGYCSVSEAGMILQANLTLATLLGVARAALLQQPLSHFILKQDQDVFYRLHRRMAPSAAADGDSCELRMTRPDGTVLWALLQARLMPDAEPVPQLRVVLTDISQRKQIEDALHASHGVQTVLLHEVHHRVKNNLQIINSLLRLESGRSEQRETKVVLSEMQGRIRAMAILHELLYREGTLASVNLGNYLGDLATQVFRAEAGRGGAVRLQLELAPVLGGMDQAIACGLLVNELVTNSLKHGFAEGRDGEVRVVLKARGAAEGGKLPLHLCVSDTGVGLGADFETRRHASLGLQLVGDLSKQLGGELVVGTPGGPGAVFFVNFLVDQSKLPALPSP